MARDLKPLPKNSSDFLQETLVPYDNSVSKTPTNNVFTKNRAEEISLKGKQQKDFSISLKDHDEVVKYYFENTIKPTVIQNDELVVVPIMYGNPERWKTVQADGALRDKSGKLLVPLIMYKRDTLEKNRSLGNKLDGNKVNNYQVFKQKFNPKNQYDRFSILTNRQASDEMYLSVIPDYVTLKYSCIIFTDYVEQMNPIIEAINFASDSYWGDFSRFRFRATIDSFTSAAEVTTVDGRAVKSTFNISLQGYIIPDTINKQLASQDLFYSTSQLVFNLETSTADLDTIDVSTGKVAKGGTASTTIFEGGSNVTNITQNTTVIGSSIDTNYLGASITKTAVTITTNTAIFNAAFIQPANGSSLPATSVSNFTFYVNGIYIPITNITSFVDNGSGTCTLTVNTTNLGYNLESTDEIVAIGKFV
jgi:hypothetical protein